ncbi:hypothetical protein [Methanobrevibacter sp.]|uniref:hypothetical protein n=1 Tax=Methanobrevibacter sp. TaxID=66852 RepID=UPI0026DEF8BA|nr:hypothetical protein [Methanobrevibacter sp.]MDO5860792.1 hypothetical protein [Methanobrevibacter sp.]
MMETKLKENADKLNISVSDLIDRYIKRELYSDDYYVAPSLSIEEIEEMLKKDVEMDKKRGIIRTQPFSNALVGICNKKD